MILLPWDLIQITDFYIKTKAAIIRRMAVSVYGGKQQKYGKSATFVQASSDASLPSNIKDRFWASAPMSI